MSQDMYEAKELEWFDLSTRVRELVVETLRPSVEVMNNEKEYVQSLSKQLKTCMEEVKELQIAVFKNKSAETYIGEINDRLVTQETLTAKSRVIFEETIEFFKVNNKSLEFTVNSSNKLISELQDGFIRQSDEIQNFRAYIDGVSEKIISQVRKFEDEFKKINRTYSTFVSNCEEKVSKSVKSTEENVLLVRSMEKTVESLREMVINNVNQVRTFDEQKADIDELNAAKSALAKSIRETNQTIDYIKSELIKRDGFIDKYYPLRVTAMISDALFSCINKNQKRKLAKYERNLVKNLNLALSNTSEQLSRELESQRLLDQMNKIEGRIKDFYAQRKKEKMQIAENTSLVQMDRIAQVEVDDDEEEFEDSEDGGAHEHQITEQVLNDILDKCRGEFSEQLAKTQKNLISHIESYQGNSKQLEQQMQLYILQVQSQIEQLEKSFKKERGDQLIELSSNAKEVNELRDRLANISNSIRGLVKLSACMVECNQIDAAILAYEEGHVQETPTDGFIDGRRRSITRTPIGDPRQARAQSTATTRNEGQLVYKQQVYNKADLLALKSKMMVMGWEDAMQHFDWNKQHLVNIYNQAKKETVPQKAQPPPQRKKEKAKRPIEGFPFLAKRMPIKGHHRYLNTTLQQILLQIIIPVFLIFSGWLIWNQPQHRQRQQHNNISQKQHQPQQIKIRLCNPQKSHHQRPRLIRNQPPQINRRHQKRIKRPFNIFRTNLAASHQNRHRVQLRHSLNQKPAQKAKKRVRNPNHQIVPEHLQNLKTSQSSAQHTGRNQQRFELYIFEISVI